MPQRIAAPATRPAANLGTMLDTWHRLHDPSMAPPKKVHTAAISSQAKKLSENWGRSGSKSLSAREWQDTLDELQGFAKANPFWPALKQMGVTDTQAHAAVHSLKSFDASRRTSLADVTGMDGLKKGLDRATQFTGVVNGLLAGKSIDGLLKGLTPVEAKALTNAQRLGPAFVLHSAVTMLNNSLGCAITDNATDLLSSPKETAAALEAAVRGRTAWLKMGDRDEVDVLGYIDVNAGYAEEFGNLRELAVLDPARAQAVGKAFVSALQAAAKGGSSDFAIR